MPCNRFAQSAADIDWYCERGGIGPHLALIPSCEGDCSSFARVAEPLSDELDMLTFDMPGFSRSSAPPGLGKVSASKPRKDRSVC